MAGIVDKFIGQDVTVSKDDGNGATGKLIKIDTFGVLVMGEVDSQHEVKEKVAIYIPHKNITMIHAREDDNKEFNKTFWE